MLLGTMSKKADKSMPILAGRLKYSRLQAGFTQNDVSQALKLGIGQLSKYENGQVVPGLELLQKMARMYGVSIDYLAGESDVSLNKTQDLSEDEAALVQAARRGDAATLLDLLTKFKSDKRKQ